MFPESFCIDLRRPTALTGESGGGGGGGGRRRRPCELVNVNRKLGERRNKGALVAFPPSFRQKRRPTTKAVNCIGHACSKKKASSWRPWRSMGGAK